MANFFRRFVGRINAKAFYGQLDAIKIILYKRFIPLIQTMQIKTNSNNEDISSYISVQVDRYLMGEKLYDINDEMDMRAKEFVIEMRDSKPEEIPQIAEKLMDNDKELRELVVYTLRKKMIIAMMVSKGSAGDYFKTDEGKRIAHLLDKYGGEFKEELNLHKYDELVNKLITEYKQSLKSL